MVQSELPNDYRKAFKGADIRGEYPAEIDESLVYRVAYYLVTRHSISTVAVARDMRLSSPSLMQALKAGVRDAGADVLDLGLVPTPVLYFASGTRDVWGIMITASHNPASYNGLKIVQPGAVPLTERTGLRDIKKAIRTEPKPTSRRGGQRSASVLASYVQTMHKRAPVVTGASTLRVVADAGNGMASHMLQAAKKYWPVELTIINADLDGSFPSRASNPMLRKNQKPIREALKTGRYDMGVAFDGDGDRVAFFDASGRMINSAVIGALIAEEALAQHPKASCVYTVFTSRIYEDVIRQSGGRPVRAKVGHSFIKEKMRQSDAVFGCEHSGHFYFKDNYYADSSMLACQYVFAACEHHGLSLSTLAKRYEQYHQTEEVLVEVVDKTATLEACAQQYQTVPGVSINRFDGVSVTTPEYWFTLKPSVTEDALKYVVEASTKKKASQVQTELAQFLSAHKK